MKLRIYMLASALLYATALTAAEDTGAALASAGAGGSSQPQLLLNGDGVIGVRSEPAYEAGHGIASLGAGLEYVPFFAPALGFNAGYDYLAESKNPLKRDNDLDLSLRIFGPDWGSVNAWLLGGVGYNTTPNTVNGHYLAFVGPGLRWRVLSHLAIDAGLRYMSQSPKSAFVQSFGETLGLSIPLDGAFSFGGSPVASNNPVPTVTPSAVVAQQVQPIPQATPQPTPLPTPQPTLGTTQTAGLRCVEAAYVVRKGDDLWKIAAKTVGDPALWPLLLKLNRSQVVDPDSIEVGDTLYYRTAYTVREIAAAVRAATVKAPVGGQGPR